MTIVNQCPVENSGSPNITTICTLGLSAEFWSLIYLKYLLNTQQCLAFFRRFPPAPPINRLWSFSSVRSNFLFFKKYELSTTVQYWVNEGMRQTDTPTNITKDQHFRLCSYWILSVEWAADRWSWFDAKQFIFDEGMRGKTLCILVPSDLTFDVQTSNFLPYSYYCLGPCILLFRENQRHMTDRRTDKQTDGVQHLMRP